MTSALHPSVIEQAAEYRRRFEQAQPFRHVVLEPFLDEAFCRRLIAEFPAFDQRRAINERGAAGGMSANPQLSKLRPAYAEFDLLMSDPDFLGLMGHITGIEDLLYDPEYLGGGTHENLNGQELDRHVDFNYHSTTGWHRRLNLILFLNPEWEESWGGCLELVADPRQSGGVTAYAPLANRAVIFETTESSWHGFERIQIPEGKDDSRRSIAVYFYTADRPADQTEAPHATIYYQRPLPERFQPGYTLQQPDVTDLERLLIRHNTHLDFLYKRELEFRRREQEIRKSLSFRVGRALTWPVRALRSAFSGERK